MGGYWYMWVAAGLGLFVLVGLIVVYVKRTDAQRVLRKCPECRRVSKVPAVGPSTCPRCGWELTHVKGRAPIPLWVSPLVIAALAVAVYGVSTFVD